MSTEKTNEENQFQYRLRKTPIAIIGMSSVFPKAKNLNEYWQNILSEVDCITSVPESRWSLKDYYDSDPSTPDKTYSNKGGFIPDIDFDPMEFGLPPNILEVTEVAQLLSLVLAKDVLKDGNYGDASQEIREKTGVILGVGGGQKLVAPLTSRLQYPIWDRVLKSVGINASDREVVKEKLKKAYIKWEENSFPGTLGNIISGRITNRLDLGGTNCVVDAACASSLSGIRMAVAELLDYRTDMMISGGVDLDNSIYMYMCFSKTPAFTHKDINQPFDKNSAGIMIGEGIGMLLLKRYEDALRDGDKIYSVIKAIGSSSDGKFKSIYAPRPAGQQLALGRAYEEAGFSPATVGLLEGHGTGTKAGDLAEVTALKDYFNKFSPEIQSIALGSVKSQIGHTKNAAGVASIIKTSLALHHNVLPATINVKEPNPELGLEDSPFYLNTESRTWVRAKNSAPRRAGISAFGFGGTNFHFVLEEHNSDIMDNSRIHSIAKMVLLDAKSPELLLDKCNTLLTQLHGDEGQKVFQGAYRSSQNLKIDNRNARIGFIAETVDEAITHLDSAISKLEKQAGEVSWSKPSGIHYRKEGVEENAKVVALFSGQGSPYLNMGQDIVSNFPELMESNAQMDQLFIDDGLNSLSSIVYPQPVFNKEKKRDQEQKLQLTENAQPSIGVFSSGQFQILKNAGFKADFTAGHSFGELTALWAAGVYSFEDFLVLSKARGKAMAAPDDPNFDAGGMVAVIGKVEKLKEDLKDYPDVVLANFNSNKQVVIAGAKKDMKSVAADLKNKGYTTVMLGVSAAFHTPLVGHAQKPFAKTIKSIKFKKPKCKVFSNASGKAYPTKPAEIQQILEEHILNPVHFVQEIENIQNKGGYYFIEFGPQQILTKLVGNILKDKPHLALAINSNPKKPADRQLRNAVLQLRIAGLELSEIDPYNRDEDVEIKKYSALKMKLGGSNYVSPKTKQEFEDALADGFKIKQAKIPEPIIEKVIEKVYSPQKTDSTNGQNDSSVDAKFLMDSVDKSLSSFQIQQNETLKVHEQFLANQAEYSKGFLSLMTQQSDLMRNNGRSIPTDVAENMKTFHQHQNETMRIHEQYISQQVEYTRGSFEMIRQQHSQLFGETVGRSLVDISPVFNNSNTTQTTQQPALPSEVHQTPAAPKQVKAQKQVVPPVIERSKDQASQNSWLQDNSKVVEALLTVVSEKTGYLGEMLDLSMDMESDLGIDSIKRVEILHGVQDRLPGLKELNPDDLTELRTLQEIVDHIAPSGKSGQPEMEKKEVIKHQAETKSTVVSSSVDKKSVVAALLLVVSEKTGYLQDMLDLEMDMESDLGIDSIKRVEILHGVQEALPDLPEVNPDDLAELRTLDQIVENLFSENTENSSSISTTSSIAQISHDQIINAMLVVVSEKTGYLQEMLDLEMDMESDLGIDSIKRVEILHGIQEALPELPEVDPDDLAELRTLNQIVDKMLPQEKSLTDGSEIAGQQSSKKEVGQENVVDTLLKIVSEKTGYLQEMLDISMDMESDLGIDSIKRVEILHGVQEALPELPEINPDELAELRTLEQIIQTLSFPVVEDEKNEKISAATPVGDSISFDNILSAMLEVVSEKTGYLKEMLDLQMDMESDLGIDSIKRVEILHGIQEMVPELPEVNPDDLAELRTLQQIVEKMVPQAPVQPLLKNNGSNGRGQIIPALLKVVSEKTGYPENMIDLNMDMESDLGIDSIKRVEILHGVQESLPNLPEINPDDLADLRSLEQIVQQMNLATPVITKKEVENTTGKKS
ncbi:MAG: acyltransferase domain-containing protein [Proteobacteria bacterium]|nr:acyltransferase domain-containing protein [Pseudomonadota bacterium]